MKIDKNTRDNVQKMLKTKIDIKKIQESALSKVPNSMKVKSTGMNAYEYVPFGDYSEI